jgi:membrane-bound lytic murein transglycosylase F
MTDPAQQKARLRRIRLMGIIIALLLSIPILLYEISGEKDHLHRVKAEDVLKVITFNGPTTYYEGSQGPNGFEYDLVSAFAEHLGVDLQMITVDRLTDIPPKILAGHVDFAAAGLAITEERSKQLLFSEPYQTIKQQVVYRSGSKRPREPKDLVGRDLMVTSGSSHVERLLSLQQELPELRWQETPDETPEGLLVRVSDKELDLTLADSNIVSIVRQFYPELQIAFSLPPDDKLAWMFTRSNDTSLLDEANRFIAKMIKNGEMDRLLDRYYGPSARFNYVNTTAFLERIDNVLPLYEDMFRRAGKHNDIDWRLLAAQAYQESHWNAEAVSPTGVRGIMMLTKATAKRLKVKNRRSAAQSIRGGSEYLKLLRDGLPERIQEPDRTWLALAAYNVGLGHLEDARILTQKGGKDPDSWLDVQEFLPLLAKPEWHKKTRYGYARGYEPVAYVNRIRGYYEILSWYDDRRRDPVESINKLDMPAL